MTTCSDIPPPYHHNPDKSHYKRHTYFIRQTAAMPPRLPVRSLLSAAALRPCRVQAVRTLATPATGEEDSGPVDPTDMFMDAAPQGKVKSGAIIVKYAGMGAPITPVSRNHLGGSVYTFGLICWWSMISGCSTHGSC